MLCYIKEVIPVVEYYIELRMADKELPITDEVERLIADCAAEASLTTVSKKNLFRWQALGRSYSLNEVEEPKLCQSDKNDVNPHPRSNTQWKTVVAC